MKGSRRRVRKYEFEFVCERVRRLIETYCITSSSGGSHVFYYYTFFNLTRINLGERTFGTRCALFNKAPSSLCVSMCWTSTVQINFNYSLFVCARDMRPLSHICRHGRVSSMASGRKTLETYFLEVCAPAGTFFI
jgi:hypothetical protein